MGRAPAGRVVTAAREARAGTGPRSAGTRPGLPGSAGVTAAASPRRRQRGVIAASLPAARLAGAVRRGVRRVVLVARRLLLRAGDAGVRLPLARVVEEPRRDLLAAHRRGEVREAGALVVVPRLDREEHRDVLLGQDLAKQRVPADRR